jgi:hypothetical protein
MQPTSNDASDHGKNGYEGHEQLARLDELPGSLVPFGLVRAAIGRTASRESPGHKNIQANRMFLGGWILCRCFLWQYRTKKQSSNSCLCT